MAFKIIQKTPLRGIFGSHIVRNLSTSQILSKDSKEDSAKKLQDLLQSIIKDDSLREDSKSSPSLASSDQIIPKKKQKEDKPKDLGKKIIKAAEDVAKTLSGKPEETEAQLLHRLLYTSDKNLSQSLMKEASAKSSLTDLLSDMTIERTEKRKIPPSKMKDVEYSRAEKVRDILGRQEFIPRKPMFIPHEKINLFGEEKLGVFNAQNFESEEKVKMNTWEAVRNRDLKLLITHPPSNIYEQMIIWTERGILWKFPINNEYGLEEEENTDFTEHVFLEQQIEDWCPEHGPIRHFMELVCVGLSRNYWLSAKEKRDHLLWYKDFFSSKKELIKELGAGEIRTEQAPQIQ